MLSAQQGRQVPCADHLRKGISESEASGLPQQTHRDGSSSTQTQGPGPQRADAQGGPRTTRPPHVRYFPLPRASLSGTKALPWPTPKPFRMGLRSSTCRALLQHPARHTTASTGRASGRHGRLGRRGGRRKEAGEERGAGGMAGRATAFPDLLYWLPAVDKASSALPTPRVHRGWLPRQVNGLMTPSSTGAWRESPSAMHGSRVSRGCKRQWPWPRGTLV